MSEERIELSTNGLKGHCSTIELLAHRTAILTRTEENVNGMYQVDRLKKE